MKMKALLTCLTTLAAAMLAVPSAQAQDVKAGNAAEGHKKAAMCIGCHGITGYQATFPEVYKVPKIAGQGAPYIVSALTEYQKGERRHPTMRGISGSLSEQDMSDLAAYYASLYTPAERAPDTAAAADTATTALITKGACASCHGPNFTKPIDPSYPKLAGQYADYLYATMKAYQVDNGNVFGRTHAVMGAQLKPFTHAEMKAIASYIASLPSELATVPQPKFIDRTASAK